jgi:PAS domain S-box-containing protein
MPNIFRPSPPSDALNSPTESISSEKNNVVSEGSPESTKASLRPSEGPTLSTGASDLEATPATEPSFSSGSNRNAELHAIQKEESQTLRTQSIVWATGLSFAVFAAILIWGTYQTIHQIIHLAEIRDQTALPNPSTGGMPTMVAPWRLWLLAAMWAGLGAMFIRLVLWITAERDIEQVNRTIGYQFLDKTLGKSGGYVTLSNKGEISRWSQGAERLMGYTEAEVFGRRLGVLYGSMLDEAESLPENILALAGKHGHHRFNATLTKADGSSLIIEGVAFNDKDHKGTSVGYLLYLRDITSDFEASQRLGKRAKELETIAYELDAFVYRSYHDLRAPLATGLGLVELSRMESNPNQRSQYLDLLRDSIMRLDRNLTDIAALAQSAQRETKWGPVDFDKLLEKVQDQLAYLPGLNEISIVLTINGESTFQSDPDKLGTIIKSLLSNAVKYRRRDDEQPYVDIIIDTTGDGLILYMADNGLGIPKEQINKVFDMFYRANEHADGMGLGLYIVRQTVLRLGGTIELNSRESRGTSVRVVLPSLTSA